MHRTPRTILLILVVICQEIFSGCTSMQAKKEGAKNGSIQAAPEWQTGTSGAKPASASPTKVQAMRTPTITRTPTPTLAVHEWTPDEILIRFSNKNSNDYSYTSSFLPPNLTLYANGQVFIYHETTEQLLTKQLSNENICELLYTIDQTGFFNLPSSYSFTQPRPTSLPLLYQVEVNAWRRNNVDIYSVPGIYNPLRNIVRLLSGYQPENLALFQPGQLGIWFSGDPRYHFDSVQWPLITPKLSDLYNRNKAYSPFSKPDLILEGGSAIKIFDVIRSIGLTSIAKE